MNFSTLGWLAASAALAACASSGGDSGGADGGSSSPDGSPGASSSGAPGASSGASSSSGGPGASGSGGDGGDGGSSAPPAAPSSVTLKNVGRRGDTLLLSLQGSDAAGLTTEAHVHLSDGAGAPVKAFDTNWDGIPDSADQLLHFDQSTLGKTTFTQTITLPGLFDAAPTVASAVVSLSNVYGSRSPTRTASLQKQTTAMAAAACDPAEIDSRCVEGLACTGQPATCQSAAAPSLTQVGYYGGVSPAQVFVGSAPTENLASIQVTFLDAASHGVNVDLGTGTAVSSFTLDARGASGQSFYFVNSPAPTFTQFVAKISATAYDTLGHAASPVVATLGMQPLVPNGQTCDARGLVGCYQGSGCSPGVVGAKNVCNGIPALQAAKCTAAPQAATQGTLAAWGTAQGVSLWDPPAGCTFPTAVNHPETLVALTLTKAVSTLTLSTEEPETNFDTILYVLPSCAATSSSALGCNDDDRGYASKLTLSGVAAGTYYVVVDSATSTTGQFGLSILAQ